MLRPWVNLEFRVMSSLLLDFRQAAGVSGTAGLTRNGGRGYGDYYYRDHSTPEHHHALTLNQRDGGCLSAYPKGPRTQIKGY